MEIIKQIFNSSQLSYDPLNFIAIITTVIVSLYILKRETSISFIRERHDKLFFPLFNILEPVLYQQLDTEILNNALKLIDENKNLADGKLIELYYYCSKTPSEDNFKDLCSYADHAYDQSCRKLGLKTRSWLYRFFRKQFKSKLESFLFIVGYSLFSIIVMLIAFLMILLLVFGAYSIYEQANQANQLLMLCFLAILMSVIYKYITKHY